MIIYSLIQCLQDFVFYYLFFMLYLWMIGGVVYYFLFEEGCELLMCMIVLSGILKVLIVVFCFNEVVNVCSVIGYLNGMQYLNYDIIVVNDGSKDCIGEIFNELVVEILWLFVIYYVCNEGKVVGFMIVVVVLNVEYLLCIDGDVLFVYDVIGWMFEYFLIDLGVGVVIGNLCICMCMLLFGCMQVGEFLLIVGLIKCMQQVYGCIFMVLGVIMMFCKIVFVDVGYWSLDMFIEDIDISWKLQCCDWCVVYELYVFSWILMLEMIKGFYWQWLCWFKGGIQVLFKYVGMLMWLIQMMMWLLFVEYLIGIVWVYLMLFILLFVLIDVVYLFLLNWYVFVVLYWYGMLLVVICILQLIIGSMIDCCYDEKFLMYFFDIIWYFVVFWLISMIIIVIVLFVVVLWGCGKCVVWVSFD